MYGGVRGGVTVYGLIVCLVHDKDIVCMCVCMDF